MAAIVADTHAALWYLTDNPKPATAARALDAASASGDPILISSISLVEMTYLVEKGRLPVEARQRLVDALGDPEGPYELADLDAQMADAVERIDRDTIPDMPDRIIAATALARALSWSAATAESALPTF
jgi:PIN domain nuclease of toxin-antitoxin system